ncbi:site-specific integrase [Flavobacteriaceae bacterium GSB9]|nr:site-specific integrase [Flavobacteriaceae bacterium GSB9]
MATLKLTLDKRRKYKDGRSPLIFRLTHKGRSTSIHIGIKLLEREWNANKLRIKNSHPFCKELNIELKNKQTELEILAFRNAEKIMLMDQVKKVKQLLIEKPQNTAVYFSAFAKEKMKVLKEQERYGNAQSYKTASDRILRFKGMQLELNQIDYNLILSFENYLLIDGVSRNSVAVYMRTLRAILNLAAKEDKYNLKNYPFKKYKIRTEKTISRAIGLLEIRKIYQLDDLTNKEEQAKDIFLLILSLIGISFMDLILLKKSNIDRDRIIYKRRKTGKVYSIKLSSFSIRIIKKYCHKSSDFILPQFQQDNFKKSQYRHCVSLGLNKTNKYLKKIGKRLDLPITLTTYVARYSWANIAKSTGCSKELIAEALGHTYGNHVTGIYLDTYGNDLIDGANKQIIKKCFYEL